MDLKFYRSASSPTSASTGSIWFNTIDKSLNLKTNSGWEKYGGENLKTFNIVSYLDNLTSGEITKDQYDAMIAAYEAGAVFSDGNSLYSAEYDSGALALTKVVGKGSYVLIISPSDTGYSILQYLFPLDSEQSDWNVTDTSLLTYIKNKPTKLSDFTNDLEQNGIEVYDVSPLEAKFGDEHFGNYNGPLTAEEFAIVREAYDSGKWFLTSTGEIDKPVKTSTTEFETYVWHCVVNKEANYYGREYTIYHANYNNSESYTIYAFDKLLNENITKLSQLQNDKGFITASDISIPTKTSELDNDSGFITELPDLTLYAKERDVVKYVESCIGYDSGYTLQTVTINLEADKFYIVGACQGLTLTLPTGSDVDGKEYCVHFYVSTSRYTLTLPSSVKWQNGSAPAIDESSSYQLVICNNCATIGKFK